jgi:hypothetical protein
MNNYNDQQIGGYVVLSIIATCIIFAMLYGFFSLIYCCYKEYFKDNNIYKPLI